MRVGVFAKDTSDEGLRFLKQIGVDDVDLRLEYLEEYRTSGSLTAASARRVVERYAGSGCGSTSPTPRSSTSGMPTTAVPAPTGRSAGSAS